MVTGIIFDFRTEGIMKTDEGVIVAITEFQKISILL